MMRRWLTLILFVLLSCVLPARAQVEGCSVNGWECLHLIPVCSQRWQATNVNPFAVEAYWQIWSAYEYVDPADAPIILYEGVLNIPARSRVTFTTPANRPVMLVWGAIGGGEGPLAPSARPCSAPARACTDVFKIAIPPDLRSDGAQFVLYHVGDVFLETYTDAHLGFDIQMGAVNEATGQVALLLCRDTWPGNMNFVGMIEGEGSRVKIIELTLLAIWPEVYVSWTAPGVENVP